MGVFDGRISFRPPRLSGGVPRSRRIGHLGTRGRRHSTPGPGAGPDRSPSLTDARIPAQCPACRGRRPASCGSFDNNAKPEESLGQLLQRLGVPNHDRLVGSPIKGFRGRHPFPGPGDEVV